MICLAPECLRRYAGKSELAVSEIITIAYSLGCSHVVRTRGYATCRQKCRKASSANENGVCKSRWLMLSWYWEFSCCLLCWSFNRDKVSPCFPSIFSSPRMGSFFLSLKRPQNLKLWLRAHERSFTRVYWAGDATQRSTPKHPECESYSSRKNYSSVYHPMWVNLMFIGFCSHAEVRLGLVQCLVNASTRAKMWFNWHTQQYSTQNYKCNSSFSFHLGKPDIRIHMVVN